MTIVGVTSRIIAAKVVLFWVIILVDIILNSFFELTTKSSIETVPEGTDVYTLFTIQLCSTGLVVLWFFVIIWSTFLLRYGLIGILLRSFKYTFLMIALYCMIFGIERAMRLMNFIKNEDKTDTVIWDLAEYRILFYLRHLTSFIFYGLLMNSSIRLSTPDYYKPKKWLK